MRIDHDATIDGDPTRQRDHLDTGRRQPRSLVGGPIGDGARVEQHQVGHRTRARPAHGPADPTIRAGIPVMRWTAWLSGSRPSRTIGPTTRANVPHARGWTRASGPTTPSWSEPTAANGAANTLRTSSSCSPNRIMTVPPRSATSSSMAVSRGGLPCSAATWLSHRPAAPAVDRATVWVMKTRSQPPTAATRLGQPGKPRSTSPAMRSRTSAERSRCDHALDAALEDPRRQAPGSGTCSSPRRDRRRNARRRRGRALPRSPPVTGAPDLGWQRRPT